MSSRTSAINETCECEKVISSAIYKTENKLFMYRSDHILDVLVQDCPHGDALVDFYSR